MKMKKVVQFSNLITIQNHFCPTDFTCIAQNQTEKLKSTKKTSNLSSLLISKSNDKTIAFHDLKARIPYKPLA